MYLLCYGKCNVLTGQKYSFTLFLVASLYNYNLKNLKTNKQKKAKKKKKCTEGDLSKKAHLKYRMIFLLSSTC